MPIYHFVKEKQELEPGKLPKNRLMVTYRLKEPVAYDWGALERVEMFSDDARKMIVGNCEGSLTVIENQRPEINKLHIGSLTIATPHVEAYENNGAEGPRADLFHFDFNYAKSMYDELVKWKDPQHRELTRRVYVEGPQWYSVPHRLKQLNISMKGLDRKIRQMRKLKGSLRKLPDPNFVSRTALSMESQNEVMVGKMDKSVRDFHAQNPMFGKKHPKIISNPEIMSIGEGIYRNLQSLLDFVVPQIDVGRARNYWKEIDNWENL